MVEVFICRQIWWFVRKSKVVWWLNIPSIFNVRDIRHSVVRKLCLNYWHYFVKQDGDQMDTQNKDALVMTPLLICTIVKGVDRLFGYRVCQLLHHHRSHNTTERCIF